MSFNYLYDLFGKFRKRKCNKFTDLERKATKMLKDVRRGSISLDEFCENYPEIIHEFNDLSGNVIDENTPGWILMFSSNVFLRWRDWHVLKSMHTKYPQKFSDPKSEKQYQEIADMNFDEWLMSKIDYCLENL